jgi:Ni/Co efflux regulator RcnB
MMNKLLSGLMATTLAASFAIASAVPLNAAPVYAPQTEQARSDVVKVHNPWRQGWRSERRYHRWGRRHAWRDRYYYDNDGYYAYRPRYYNRYYGGDYYPRYYRRHRPGVSLYLNF